MPKISKDIEKAIINLHLVGKSYIEISKLLSVGKNTIGRCLKRNKINPTKYDQVIISRDIESDIISSFNENMMIKDIVKKYGYSDYIVRKLLIKNNIKLRGSGNHIFVSDAEITNILDLYDKNVSLVTISKITGYNPKLITKIVTNNRDTKTQKNTREKHGFWKGGRLISKEGYISLRLSRDDKFYSMCNSGGYVMEHRYIMAEHLGRCLTRQETVHHIDGNRSNNDISNLQLRQSAHGCGQKFICCDCGSHNIKSEEI